MGDLYAFGVFMGIGVGLGVLAAGLLAGARLGTAVSVAVAAAAGAGLGLWLADAEDALAGGLGGVAGALGAGVLVSGALRRGGARIATGALLGLAAVLIAVLAFIPGVGYVEALVLPALAARLRRRGGRRYAGLRTLARD
jgi:hypothetical protein